MKKAIFLNETPYRIDWVYSPDVRERIRNYADLGDTVYGKADVLANPEKFRDTEMIFSTWGMPTFTAEEIDACFPKLECVFYAAGTVQKFARPFIEKGVKVFSAWAANAVPVVEYAVAQIILANKGFFAHSYFMKNQEIDTGKKLKKLYPGNYNENVGLLGCGMIGSMVAERLKAYKLNVLAFDPFMSDEKAAALGVKKASLEEIFSTCRVVSNHLANNPQTVGMINYSHFSSMIPYSTFINTGRGAQIVEEDLVRFLGERPDVTAVLDVTDPKEPPEAGHPFYSLPNCVLTPHIAGSLGNEVVRMSEYMAEEFDSYMKGEPTRYEVSLKMLETMA